MQRIKMESVDVGFSILPHYCLKMKIGRTALKGFFFRGTEDEKTFISVRKLGNFKNVLRKTLESC